MKSWFPRNKRSILNRLALKNGVFYQTIAKEPALSILIQAEELALSNQSASKGFTLIEMIIAVTIMMLLLAGTIAGYSSYNDKQKLKQTGLTLKSNLRMARTNAMSGKKPVTCLTGDSLMGYTMSFTDSTYTVTPTCSSGPVPADASVVALPDGINFSPVPSNFIYKPLTQGVSGSPTSVILTDGTNSLTLTIDSATGEISD